MLNIMANPGSPGKWPLKHREIEKERDGKYYITHILIHFTTRSSADADKPARRV